ETPAKGEKPVSFLLSECGMAVGNNRIIGGQDAPPGSWPWQVLLAISGFFQCGGSLISDQWVLTAAHCITSQEVNDAVVVLGLQSWSGPYTNLLTRKLDKVICHPQYSFITHKNDICLLRLSAPVNFTNYIRPICLASENSTFNDGTSSWVTGFGISSNLTFPDTLQEVNVPVVGNNKCQCYNNDLVLAKVTENMICTGPEAGGKSPCFGDGGGPLMINKDSVWIQSGIVSYSVGCAQPLRPHVYTRVSKYQKWISDTITDKKPGFVTFTSPGTDSDLNFNCSAFVRPTPVPGLLLPLLCSDTHVPIGCTSGSEQGSAWTHSYWSAAMQPHIEQTDGVCILKPFFFF
uniref:Peptidase S1 domain-containing protein n=1 Tax=Amphilophus citrinellus TaxID=61819 RepID=A0A3Q0S1Z1_AMPCI